MTKRKAKTQGEPARRPGLDPRATKATISSRSAVHVLNQIGSGLATHARHSVLAIRARATNPRKPWSVVALLALVLAIITFGYEFIPKTVWYQCFTNPFRPKQGKIVVADFAGGGEGLTWSIASHIHDRLSSTRLTSSFEVRRLRNITPESQEAAAHLAQRCNALLLIWGRADDYGVDVRYVVANPPGYRLAEPPMSVAIPNIEQYRVYMVTSIPLEYDYLTLLTLGQVAYFDGTYQEAARILEQAISTAEQIDKESPTQTLSLPTAQRLRLDFALFYLGNSYDSMGRPDDSIKAYSAALALWPSSPQLLLNRGYVYHNLSDLPKAQADFQKALSIDPLDADAHSNLAAVLYRAGDISQALMEYDTAIVLDGSLTEAYFNRALAKQKLGDTTGAIVDLRRFLEMGDDRQYPEYRAWARRLISDPLGPWLIPWDAQLPK